ncbi:VOC family protein [Streptomyces sp. TR06-5]|uniref:VOC family protein n=1 Tax=unclassified Streptomyces TaxID=2593676 RepID=UPI0039A34769
MAGFAEGEPCWAVAMLPDVAAGKRFYGQLLGWSFGDPDPERHAYTTATLDGKAVAGLLGKPDGRMPTDWNVHLNTPDAAAAASRARDAGGQVVVEPFPLGSAGTTSVVADPGGAVFQLWEPGSMQGHETSGVPGAYAWAEVHTRAGDKEAVDGFYSEVFGFATEDLSEELGHDYLLWTPRGGGSGARHAVGGRALIAADVPEQLPAHFLLYFAVADCDEAVRLTGRLGGRTVLEPTDTRFGRHAVLVDDQGAYFAVIALEGVK